MIGTFIGMVLAAAAGTLFMGMLFRGTLGTVPREMI